jgi:anti-sigma factor RsiW
VTSRHLETELIPYLRGELAAEELDRVARHLADCSRCRDELERTREVLAVLRTDMPEPPEIDWRRYRVELRTKLADRTARRWTFAVPRLVPIGAMAAIGGLALVLTVHSGLFRSAPGEDLPAFDQTAIGTHLELLSNYPVVENLDLFEDYEVVQDLDTLSPAEEG